jgi:hypothetical protein
LLLLARQRVAHALSHNLCLLKLLPPSHFSPPESSVNSTELKVPVAGLIRT